MTSLQLTLQTRNRKVTSETPRLARIMQSTMSVAYQSANVALYLMIVYIILHMVVPSLAIAYLATFIAGIFAIGAIVASGQLLGSLLTLASDIIS